MLEKGMLSLKFLQTFNWYLKAHKLICATRVFFRTLFFCNFDDQLRQNLYQNYAYDNDQKVSRAFNSNFYYYALVKV